MTTNSNQFVISSDEEVIYESFEWKEYKVSYFNQRNLEKSNKNEDSIFVYSNDEGIVLGVCDGVGGYPMGKEASNLAAQGIINLVQKGFENVHVLSEFEVINQKIRELKVGARTTIAMAFIYKDHMRAYNIGDSEILLSNVKGNLLYRNIPHSPVGHGVAAGLIDKEESLDYPDRHIVSNLLGDEILRFEVSSQVLLKKGHTLLIGSDGLFDNIAETAIVDIIGGGSFDQVSKELSDLCRSASENKDWRKDDDVSFILARKLRAGSE